MPRSGKGSVNLLCNVAESCHVPRSSNPGNAPHQHSFPGGGRPKAEGSRATPGQGDVRIKKNEDHTFQGHHRLSR